MPLKGRPPRYSDYQHPPCRGCGGPVARRPGEASHAWAGRGCCSRSCAASLSGRGQRVTAAEKFAEAEAKHAPCVICGHRVLHRHKETMERYIDRKTCGGKPCKVAWHAECSRVAASRRLGAELPHVVDAPVREKAAVDFGGNFGRFDVVEGPSYGRAPPMPPSRTYAGVVSYGR